MFKKINYVDYIKDINDSTWYNWNDIKMCIKKGWIDYKIKSTNLDENSLENYEKRLKIR